MGVWIVDMGGKHLLIALAHVFAAATAVGAWATCDDCKAGMTDVFGVLRSDYSVQQELELFGEKISPYFPPPEFEQFALMWPSMQEAWLNDSATAEAFCVDLGMCNSDQPVVIDDCAHCMEGFGAF